MSSRTDRSFIMPDPSPWHIRFRASFQKSIGLSSSPEKSAYAPESDSLIRLENGPKTESSTILPSCALSSPSSDRLRRKPSPNMSARSGRSWFRSLPLVLHVGVVSRKYGTPNVCAKSSTGSFECGSIGRHIRTPSTTPSSFMPFMPSTLAPRKMFAMMFSCTSPSW